MKSISYKKLNLTAVLPTKNTYFAFGNSTTISSLDLLIYMPIISIAITLFYANKVYKNNEAEIGKKKKNKLRIF